MAALVSNRVKDNVCTCRYERDWGTILCPRHVRERIAKMDDPISIGDDNLCRCHCGMPCPLGKTGLAVRCSADQLAKAGVPIKKVE